MTRLSIAAIDAIWKGGKSGSGRPLLPPMPWPNYGKMTDDDLKAMFAFLQSIPAIRHVGPPAVIAARAYAFLTRLTGEESPMIVMTLRVAIAALALVLAATPVWAQATAGISGTVRDASSAVLPGVTVTATQTDTGVVRTTVSNDTGSYSLSNLSLGPYRLEAALSGFRTYAQTGIVLQVNSNPVVDPVLAIGEVTESVQVTAQAQLVDTRTSGVSTVVESQRIVELPLNARQVTQLITLSGFAVQTAASPGYSMNTGVRISVAGGSDFGVAYSLDGAPHLNVHDGTGMPLPFPDALQEFRLVTGSQEAAGGQRAGAAVNAVTRSGTNVFHGNLFEFNRDSRFNSPDFFSNVNDGLKRNQFGGTLGGPLLVDRMFVFVGYQGTTTRQTPSNLTAFVPTPAMLRGDFSAFAAPACQGGRTVVLRAPFVNNQVDPSLLSPAALNISRRLPAASNECGQVFWGSPVHQNEHQLPVRIDFQANQAHSLFGRYMLTTDYREIPFDAAGGNVLVTSEPGVDDRAHSFTLGHTWVINSAMVNSFRVVGNDIAFNKPGPKFFGPEDVGINAHTSVPDYTRIVVPNNFSVGGGNFISNVVGEVKSYGATNDFTVVRGNHQFAFGGHFTTGSSDTVSNSWAVGSYTFTGGVTGNSMSDFILGRVGQVRQASPNPVMVTQNFAGAYLQDTWKRGGVTLNYGVRWEPFFPMVFPDGDVYNFSLERFYAGQHSTAIPNAPPGFTYPGDAGFAGKSGIEKRLNNWDPRIGLAWDVNGDGRTAVRLGAGIAHDYIKQDLHKNTSSVSPFRLTVLQFNTSLENPWAGYGFNPFPYTYNPDSPVFAPYGSYLPVPPDMSTTTQYSWNAGLQRQITNRWFASATYVGTRIVNQMTAVELNPALNMGFGPCTLRTVSGPLSYPVCTTAANLDQRRVLNLANPTVSLGYLTAYDASGTQSYNGLLLSSRVELGSNLNFNANYTLSECEGLPYIGLLNPGDNYVHQPFQNNGPADRSLDEGPCPADRRHIFNLSAVLRAPTFTNPILNVLASDWTASSVLQMRSGAPLNLVIGADVALNGFQGNTGTQRPNVVSDDFYGDKDSLTNYLNAAAFAIPAAGTFGDAPYNLVRGPGFWQWDQSFARAFRLGGSNTIELRAEAFNLLNHFNLGNPGITLNNPNTFGRILTAQAPPRIWQFAIKYAF